MKALKNHVILYDAECPMCNLYTKTFVNTGMLDHDGRTSYQDVPQSICPLVDMKRAVNEIALVNTNTGEVSYGVNSLFKVIAYSFPAFKWLFSLQPFVWLASKMYAFISYNRRIIVPGYSKQHTIQPDFKLTYRLAYLLFTWLVVGYILTQYAQLLQGVVPVGNTYREYWICGGQIVFQGLIAAWYQPDQKWNYLGNMMTISLMGALLLLPAFIVNHLFNMSALLNTGYFLMVAGLMLLEHVRRTKLLNLGWLLTTSWFVYRVLILVIILKF
ncbi:DUF393 domain-containing protein [Mucilaginibacter robiniae]|uniref:DUF393 domain-containing protein n=1 Tax=Mucilaginibacter robiniae TaxID=2728022 RepID=A0A7L5E4U0_9SPHI|nr:DCC1-like thiol-disulfide oxidoreductase family protein [Mucilaginibacter robiniae]QJD98061.1 DUF393 domain-containing protein [Mucilaginibacter robiniae]